MDSNYTTKEIGKTILLTLAISGLVVVATAFPGLGYVLKEMEKRKFKKYKESRINTAIKRLEKQSLLEVEEIGDKVQIKLTEKGNVRILSYKLEQMQLAKGKWDGWWRVVIFDIPENKRTARNFLRSKMKELGFYTLQKSVLVTPWSCKNEIDFIKSYFGVNEYIDILLVKSFDNEMNIKGYFGL